MQQIAAIADPVARARALSDLIARQQDLMEQAARMRRQAIAAARGRGHSLDHLAGALGITPSRICQMAKGSRAHQPSQGQDPR